MLWWHTDMSYNLYRMGFITVYCFLFLQWIQHRSRLQHHRKSPADFLASTAGTGRSILGYAGMDTTKQLQCWGGGHLHPGDAGWDQGVEFRLTTSCHNPSCAVVVLLSLFSPKICFLRVGGIHWMSSLLVVFFYLNGYWLIPFAQICQSKWTLLDT